MPLLSWEKIEGTGDGDYVTRLHLMLRNGDVVRNVATVWPNGTWHTWDNNGTGGENSQERNVQRAKIEAAASAIEQGFV